MYLQQREGEGAQCPATDELKTCYAGSSVHVHMSIHMCMHMSIHMSIRMPVHVLIRMSIHMSVYMSAHLCVCMSIYVDAYIYGNGSRPAGTF